MKQSNEYVIAIHEAGHAVMSVICKTSLEFVTIISNDDALGECRNSVEVSNKVETDEFKGSRLLNQVLILYAGTAAESIILGTSPLETRGKIDLDKVNEIVDLPNDGLGQQRSNQAAKITWDIFSTPLAQRQIKAVADALMVHKTLSGNQVIEIMKGIAP